MGAFYQWREAPRAEFAVIGDPIAHSLSPVMQGAALRALGLPHRYVAVRVPKEEFEPALEHLVELGYQGLNVTVPLKEHAFRWARTMGDDDRRIGALNTLRLEDRSGTNTDAPGFLEVLKELGVTPPGPVCLLGAGGSARALLVALSGAGYAVRAYNRTLAKLRALVRELGVDARVMEQPDPEGCVAVVNTTSAGMTGQSLGVPWSRAPKGALAVDLFYATEPTLFLREAQGFGLTIADGRRMLVAQGALSLAWWLGKTAPREAMLEAIS